MAAGAPAALLIGLIAPGFWLVGAAWVALILGLVVVDGFTGARRDGAAIVLEAPRTLGMGAHGQLELTPSFSGATPRIVELAAEPNAKLSLKPLRQAIDPSVGPAHVAVEPVRRGEG